MSYEKLKIFLFSEDFDKFLVALLEAMSYAQAASPEADERAEAGEIHIDLDFPTEL